MSTRRITLEEEAAYADMADAAKRIRKARVDGKKALADLAKAARRLDDAKADAIVARISGRGLC